MQSRFTGSRSTSSGGCSNARGLLFAITAPLALVLTLAACGADTGDRPPVSGEDGFAPGENTGSDSNSGASAPGGGGTGATGTGGTTTGTGSGQSGTGVGGQGAGATDVVGGGVPGAAGLGASGNPGLNIQPSSGTTTITSTALDGG